ncbi:hypothetical protein MMC30_008654 [Trapelia coarctata]|nr:hypothetical protein [Trapelia coarctata]
MPLILLSGYPSSGKTHRAAQLLTDLRTRISCSPISSHSRLTVHHISDETLTIPRDAYREARTEKDARAAAYSAVKRALGREAIVVLDGMNYIKGWRYQLWCEAKAMGTGCCVIHIGTPIATARDINTRLLADPTTDAGYAEDLFENLIFRYEEPNGMTRWDSPLFTVPYEDEVPPFEAIWEAMVESDGKTKVVRPNLATVLAPATASDYLYELDKATQEILQAVLEWQKDHPGESGGEVKVGELTVELPASPLALPQLQRLRRQYISLNRQNGVAVGRIRESFVGYLNDSVQ